MIQPFVAVNRRRALDLLFAAILVVFAFASPRLIPYNMDEFSQFHTLGCSAAPLSGTYNNMLEGCGAYDLRLPGTSVYLPLRSYTYIGSAATLPFRPFWAAFQDPVAARVQGAVFLLLSVGLLAVLTGVSWRMALFASVVLPSYWLSFIIDDGTVGILICDLLLAMLLIRRGMAVAGTAVQFAIGSVVGLLLFIGIWIKLLFVWVLPACAIWGLWLAAPVTVRTVPQVLRRHWALIVAAAIGCAIPLSLLLASVDRSGHTYASVISSTGGTTLNPVTLLQQAMLLGRLVLNGAGFYERGMYIPALPGLRVLEALPLLLAVAMVGLAVLRASAAERSKLLLHSALAAMTFVVVCSSRDSWAPHHVVFALVFAVAGLAIAGDVLKSRPFLLAGLISVSLLYSASLIARLPQANILRIANFDKDRLTHFITDSHLDASTVQFHADWGTYYISNTFGDRRQVVLFRPYFVEQSMEAKRKDLLRLRDIALELKRDVLIITWVRPVSTEADPAIMEVLGRPTQIYPFDSWAIYRYHP